jgi:hypothetical protein
MANYKKKKINRKAVDHHRWLMERRIGRKLLRTEVVHHKDGDIHNNSIDNLEVMSLSEHSRKHMQGSGGNSVKLSEYDVKKIRLLISNGYYSRVIGEKFGVSESCIQDIKHGRTWSYI